jgi:2-polyprenyl-6-methoxyphenol hydroxylase-like FAD-dependent oxidoreductase
MVAFFSCESVDHEKGTVTFQNGVTVKADLIIGADGIRVRLYRFLNLAYANLTRIVRGETGNRCCP